MIKIDAGKTNLDTCIDRAQRDRVVITRDGKPVALIVGIEGMDEEQIQLGSSDKFWKLVTEWRQEKTMSRAELEERIKTAQRKPKKTR